MAHVMSLGAADQALQAPRITIRHGTTVFLALFGLALAIRLIGIDWHGYHPDENPRAAARVLAGDLTVESFYPPLFDYLIAAAYVALYAIGRVASWWDSTTAFRDAYFSDPLVFYLASRVVTAILSAFLAPLTFVFGIVHGISSRSAALAGAAAALIPGSIFWAHIAKSDVALAPAFLLVGIAASLVIARPGQRGRQALLALAIALAVSIKHSAIFFLGPLMLLMLVISTQQPHPGRLAAAWLISLIGAAILWVPLNIGIILDPEPFLAAQRVQAIMSLRSSDPGGTMAAVMATLTSADTGLPIYLILLWALIPLPLLLVSPAAGRPFVRMMLIVQAATALAMLMLVYLGGIRQPTNLWLPYISLIAVTILLTLAAYLDRPPGRERGVAFGLMLLCVVSFSMRTMPIVQQAIVPPNAAVIARHIRSIAAPGARILSAVDLSSSLPVSRDSYTEQRARHERLARKYGVTLPPSSRPLVPDPAGAYTIVPFPFVIGGLESVPPDQVTTVVAYAWPLQPEEWQLNHWQERGFRYVVADRAGHNHPVQAYRSFYRELAARCRTHAQVRTAKPLFWEQDVAIYDCAVASRS